MPDTTTYRELLELAAKAADYTIRFHAGVCKGGAYEGCERLWPDGEWRPWRPRQDDGDSLRLAVALHMTVRCYMGSTVAQIDTPGQPNAYQEVTNHADPAAATRRAVVRAAAEIQRAREAG